GVLTSIWFFITPIILDVPSGKLGMIMRLNPVTPLLVTTRELAFRGQVSMPIGFLISAILSLILLVMGIVCYRIALPVVIDRANA
ncbi:MAG: ABC transporter permease, partial [Phycisphaerae bacterium]|nr:ABC transporter permease [Phycisphaerae bacterium]